MIRRISSDQPGWGEDRIADELAMKLGVTVVLLLGECWASAVLNTPRRTNDISHGDMIRAGYDEDTGD